MSIENKTNTEIGKRIANGWKAFWAQKHIFKSKMRKSRKIKIFQSCVIPVLTYGAQTWALTKSNINRLRRTQNSMLRSIFGIKILDKIKIETILGEAQIPDIGTKLKNLR